MRSFLSLSLLAAAAAAGHIKCNDADGLDTENSIALSNGCSNGKISDGDWFTVSCDVGSKKGTFGLHLNWCLANDDGGLSIRAE